MKNPDPGFSKRRDENENLQGVFSTGRPEISGVPQRRGLGSRSDFAGPWKLDFDRFHFSLNFGQMTPLGLFFSASGRRRTLNSPTVS